MILGTNTTGNFLRIKEMEKGFIIGLMEINLMGFLKIINFMEKEFFMIMMEVNLTLNFIMGKCANRGK